jgi:hypothetical protein
MKFNLYYKYLRLTCEEASRLISKRQETALTLQEAFKLRFHTSICEPCTRFAEQVVVLDASLSRFFKAESIETHQFSADKKAELEKMIEENKS